MITARRGLVPGRRQCHRRQIAFLGMLFAAVIAGCGPTTTERLDLPPLQPLQGVDLQRYMGTWYEIAHYPHRFQKDCMATTATYTLREDGQVDVLNRCRVGALDGEIKEARGIARVADEQNNARLEVSFFGPFWGDYWIIELAPDYRYAVVGNPGRDYLWILSRDPVMADADYAEILGLLKSRHAYDTGRLLRTMHDAKM